MYDPYYMIFISRKYLNLPVTRVHLVGILAVQMFWAPCFLLACAPTKERQDKTTLTLLLHVLETRGNIRRIPQTKITGLQILIDVIGEACEPRSWSTIERWMTGMPRSLPHLRWNLSAQSSSVSEAELTLIKLLDQAWRQHYQLTSVSKWWMMRVRGRLFMVTMEAVVISPPSLIERG